MKQTEGCEIRNITVTKQAYKLNLIWLTVNSSESYSWRGVVSTSGPNNKLFL